MKKGDKKQRLAQRRKDRQALRAKRTYRGFLAGYSLYALAMAAAVFLLPEHLLEEGLMLLFFAAALPILPHFFFAISFSAGLAEAGERRSSFRSSLELLEPVPDHPEAELSRRLACLSEVAAMGNILIVVVRMSL